MGIFDDQIKSGIAKKVAREASAAVAMEAWTSDRENNLRFGEETLRNTVLPVLNELESDLSSNGIVSTLTSTLVPFDRGLGILTATLSAEVGNQRRDLVFGFSLLQPAILSVNSHSDSSGFRSLHSETLAIESVTDRTVMNACITWIAEVFGR